MAFVPVAIGLSSFVAYQYMTTSEDPIEEPLTKDKKNRIKNQIL